MTDIENIKVKYLWNLRTVKYDLWFCLEIKTLVSLKILASPEKEKHIT